MRVMAWVIQEFECVVAMLHVNVTINGIPYNDSESHGTYWVNMPDFASSLRVYNCNAV
jgi:hypothetical protein